MISKLILVPTNSLVVLVLTSGMSTRLEFSPALIQTCPIPPYGVKGPNPLLTDASSPYVDASTSSTPARVV